MLSMDCKIAWAGPASLAESPTWHVKDKKLYWIDIAENKLNVLDIKIGENREYQMPGLIGSVVVCAQGGILATVERSLIAMDLSNGRIETIATLIPDNRPDLRVNDGKCDCMGRFWIGVATEDKNKKGKLYRYDIDGQIHEMEDDIIFSNGMGWNPDCSRFYYVDSERHCVYQYKFESKLGKITARNVLIQFDKKASFKPDGLTVDALGFIWVACFNGGKIIRLKPDGTVDQEFKLPVQRPTSCMFGGDDLKTLFVTSCARDVNESQKLPTPAGSIFAISTGISGLPEYPFAG
jgi:sugar lactone lactonase YvrE